MTKILISGISPSPPIHTVHRYCDKILMPTAVQFAMVGQQSRVNTFSLLKAQIRKHYWSSRSVRNSVMQLQPLLIGNANFLPYLRATPSRSGNLYIGNRHSQFFIVSFFFVEENERIVVSFHLSSSLILLPVP